VPDLIATRFWRCISAHSTIQVKSSKGDQDYNVGAWGCECPGFKYHGKCRHYKKWQDETCRWDQLVDSGNVDDADPKCPACGAGVEAYTEMT
jgi:hypothetical protein